MKLIDEKELEPILSQYNHESNTEHNFALGIQKGVEFAEQKLLPLMIEFAEWYGNNTTKSNIHNCRCINGHYSAVFTTEQLLEQFIKTKV